MPSRKKSAVAKRDQRVPAKVEVLAAPLGPAYPSGRMLISTPLDIQAVVQTVPAGQVLTLGALRTRLAHAQGADYTCPMTTGIFLRIVAEAAEEEARADIPWWRVVRDNGQLLDKLPGGAARQASLLAQEGVSLLGKGKTPKVAPLAGFAMVL